MKVNASTRTVVAIFVVVALAIAFWMLFLGPKREKSDELSLQAEKIQASLAQNQSTVAAGEESRQAFPRNYQQLVVLGKAVPAGDESASLLVQLNHVSDRAGVTFESLEVGTSNGSEGTEAPPAVVQEEPEGETEPEGEEPPAEESSGVPAAAITPTETAVAGQPIGASVGPAGLSALPYDLTFNGSFFDVADFIKGIDSMIHTGGPDIAVDGRLVTMDGFALTPDELRGFPHLNADFSVTTYVVPPGQGITTGASPSAPAESESTTVSNLR